MEQAIKLAIEKGGYKLNKAPWYWSLSDVQKNQWGTKYIISADWKFWIALCKALGIAKKKYPKLHPLHEYLTKDFALNYATHYFRLKLTGGNEEAFWKDLLNK